MANFSQSDIDAIQTGLIDQATEGAIEVVVGDNRIRLSRPTERYELLELIKADLAASEDGGGAFLKTTFKTT